MKYHMIYVQNVQTLFRIFSNVQNLFSNVQTLFRMFRICSVNVQNVQNFQSMFRMFRLCSEYLAQKLVCSESLDFVVMYT